MYDNNTLVPTSNKATIKSHLNYSSTTPIHQIKSKDNNLAVVEHQYIHHYTHIGFIYQFLITISAKYIYTYIN
jgi:hypothetical protein